MKFNQEASHDEVIAHLNEEHGLGLDLSDENSVAQLTTVLKSVQQDAEKGVGEHKVDGKKHGTLVDQEEGPAGGGLLGKKKDKPKGVPLYIKIGQKIFKSQYRPFWAGVVCCFLGVFCELYLHMHYGIFYSGNSDIVEFLTHDFPMY